MSCYKPITAYRSKQGRNPKTGSWPLVFNVTDGYKDLPVEVPCGQCIGCRLDKSREWAARCVQEASLYRENSFVTLTYSDKFVPLDGSLQKRDLTLFFKRLRKKMKCQKVRYFACGEYGENYHRPHYHICMFGLDFQDKELYTTREGVKLYISKTLQSLWPYGYSTIGEVTYESAAYVARYVTKKITGETSDEYYQGRTREYAVMSRRPGIGRQWFDKYKTDMFAKGMLSVLTGGGVVREITPPRYYKTLLKGENPKKERQMMLKRKKMVDKSDCTPERLAVREEIKTIRFNELKRSYENG